MDVFCVKINKTGGYMSVFYPRYILTIYNAEYFGTQSDPMPMLLTDNEYWSLTNVDGATADFMGLDVQQGADATGDLFINPQYEDRQIDFTLSIKPGKVKDAETYLSRYLRPGVPATLTNANIGDNFYLNGVVSNWSMNRHAKGVTATISLQPYDRAWYADNIKIEDNIVSYLDVNYVRIQTDLPAYPVIKVDLKNKATTADAVKTISIDLSQYSYSKNIPYGRYAMVLASDSTNSRMVISLDKITTESTISGLSANAIDSIEIDLAKKRIMVWYPASEYSHLVGYHLENFVSYVSNWTWNMPSGLMQCNVTVETSAGVVAQSSDLTGYINPRFAVCPRTATDPADGKAFSPNLKAENVRKGVDILGVVGTAIVATGETYTEPMTITPTHDDQILTTDGKIVGGNITVKGVPAYTGKTTIAPSTQAQTLATANKLMDSNLTVDAVPEYTGETTITPTDTDIVLATAGKMAPVDITVKATSGSTPEYTGPTEVTPTLELQTLATAGKKVNTDITVHEITPVHTADGVEIVESSSDGEIQNITTVNQQYKIVPNVPTEGWYKAGQASAKAKTYQIAPAEQTKIVADNIKKGVSILGVAGSYEGSAAGGPITLDLTKTDSFANKIINIDAQKLSVSSVTDMSGFFGELHNLTAILNLNTLATSQATTMYLMFSNCSSLTVLDLSGFNTNQVTNMARMFTGCSALTSLDLSSFDTINVTTMNQMFFNCPQLATLNLSSFDTQNVTDMRQMFWNCSSLVELDLSSFDTSNVTDISGMSYMFAGCAGLKTLLLGDNWGAGLPMDTTLDLSSCTQLENAADVLNKLANRTYPATIKLNANVKAGLSADAIAAAKAKNWEVGS